MEEIIKKENSPEMLKVQFAAGYHYNRAEVLSYWVWGLCIISNLLVFLPKHFPELLKYLIPLAIDTLAALLHASFLKNINIASHLRKYFDAIVLDISVDSFDTGEIQKLKEIAENAREKQVEQAEIQMNNSGVDNPPGVKDWYIIPPESKEDDGVFLCQRENAWWDTRLFRKGLIFDITMAVAFLAITATIFFVLPNRHEQIFICLIGLLLKFFEYFYHLIQYVNISKKISGALTVLDKNRTPENRESLQNLINLKRSLPVVGKNRFHKRYAREYTNMVKTTF